MRDALSLLDQLSKENVEITKEMIQNNFGTLSHHDIEKIFKNLSEKNITEINSIFTEYFKKGLDVNILISKKKQGLDDASSKPCFLIKFAASELFIIFNLIHLLIGKSDGLKDIKAVI